MEFGLLETRKRLTESSLRGLEAMLESLFERPTMIPGTGLARAPVIGTQYIVALDHSVLLPTICRAMVAKEKLRQQAPGWPDLPLRVEEIAAMENADCPRLNLLGLFGSSQRAEYWHSQHPGLAAFAGGLMFDRHTPAHIRNNCGLIEEFPPVRLKGLCSDLNWQSPETLRQNRQLERMTREYETARERAGA